MREAKFRGKAVMSVEELDEMGIEHNNGWVIGNLIQNGNNPYIAGDIIEIDPEYIAHDFWVRVHPESVGQYTSIKDKNRKEIYFGHYIDIYFGGIYHKTATVKDIYDLCGLIRLIDDHGATFEIRGNIYENPSLFGANT